MRLIAPSRIGWPLCAAVFATLLLTGCGSEDTLVKIKRTGVLQWGADAEGGAPFVYRDEVDTNKIIGFEIDLMDAFCKHLGVKSERVQGEWGSLIDNMKAGRSDMVVNGMEINADRKTVVLFSEPYYVYEQQLTVRVEDRDKYKSLADLTGKKIGTLDSAEANNVLLRAGFTQDLLLPHPDSLLPYTDLELGRCEAVLQESIIAAFYAGKNPKLHNLPETFSPGKYAICVRLEDTALLAETNRILDLMKSSGELAAIYQRWGLLTPPQTQIGIRTKIE